ncbi:stage III sporulation protein AE [Oscillospiraceae bacterium 38-13]
MRYWVCVLFALLVLTADTRAAELPRDLTDALPEAAEDLLEGGDFSGPGGLVQGLGRLADRMAGEVRAILRQRLRGAASILLVAVACGAVDGFAQGTGEGKAAVFLPMVGALAVTMLTAGSLEDLIGLGVETIGELTRFSKALLPTLAAATAAAGAVSTATFHQVTTVFLVDLLLNLIDGLLIPLVYLYIGALTAGACLPENRLGAIAGGLKKLVTWILTTSLLLFTVYLSAVRVVAGAADGATVKVAKAAISGAVPVVGGIIAEAAETVLAGAGMLKNTIGVFGMLAILAACAFPFLQLGVQYLLYKLSAFLAAAVGAPGLCKLIDGLGGAFGLVLGMTGSCALLLLVSVLSSVAAVTP